VTWKLIGKFGRSGTYETPNTDLLVKQNDQLLLFLIKEYAVEFDYQKEAWFTVLGYKHYNQPSQHVYSAQLIQAAQNPFPVVIQTMAGQESLNSIVNRCALVDQQTVMRVAPLLYGTMINLVNLWVKTVFWTEDAFFHGDLHMGNIMTVSFETLLNMADRGEKFAPLYVIDYGSSGILSGRTKCRLLTAMLQSAKIQQMNVWIPQASARSQESQESQGSQGSQGLDVVAVGEDITSFFHEFDQLSISQQLGLRQALNKPEARKMHAENLKQVQIFVRRIWRLCETRDQSTEHMDSFYKRLLNYNRNVEFGSLFLGLVKHGRDIGMCTSNPVIMFGRAFAYLTGNLSTLEKLCNDPGRCKAYNMDGVITNQLLRNPTQLVNFLRGEEICQARD
jgi:hypothetical protein